MLFHKGIAPERVHTWEDIEKESERKLGGSRFVLRCGSIYGLVNDFLPILWVYGGDLLVNGNMAKLEPESQAAAAIRSLHALGHDGPPYEELLSTEGFRLELERNAAVIAIEWSAAQRRLSVPEGRWTAFPCSRSRLIEKKGPHTPDCLEAGVLATWILAAPMSLRGSKRDDVVALLGALAASSSKNMLCSLSASLSGPPVLKDCEDQRASIYYGKPGQDIYHGTTWHDATVGSDAQILLGRSRPSTPHWHEIEQRLGRNLSDVLLDLQTEEEAIKSLHKEFSDLHSLARNP